MQLTQPIRQPLPVEPPPRVVAPVSVPSGPTIAPFEKDLKDNPGFADFVKYMGLKLLGTKAISVEEAQQIKENQNGHAANDPLNAENANSNEENSGEFAESEL